MEKTLEKSREAPEQALPSATAASATAARRVRVISTIQRQGLLLILVALIVYLTVLSPYFLTVSNIFNILAAAAPLGIMAVVQTPLIVARGLDISVGSVVAVAGISLVMLSDAGMPPELAALIALAIGAAIGALNGVLVVVMGVNPLITTLGSMSIFSGLAFLISSSGAQAFTARNATFEVLGSGKFGGIVPVTVVILIVVAAIGLVVERVTPVGRAVYAIGGNPEAARLAGISARRIPFVLFLLSGLAAAFAGVISTAQLGAASPNLGTTFTLSVITAVILGGASLAGGRGSVLGTMVAVLFLGVMQNGFTLLQISSYAQTAILGIALIVAVLVDQTSRRLRSRALS